MSATKGKITIIINVKYSARPNGIKYLTPSDGGSRAVEISNNSSHRFSTSLIKTFSFSAIKFDGPVDAIRENKPKGKRSWSLAASRDDPKLHSVVAQADKETLTYNVTEKEASKSRTRYGLRNRIMSGCSVGPCKKSGKKAPRESQVNSWVNPRGKKKLSHDLLVKQCSTLYQPGRTCRLIFVSGFSPREGSRANRA